MQEQHGGERGLMQVQYAFLDLSSTRPAMHPEMRVDK
jgi:hypothetical protein